MVCAGQSGYDGGSAICHAEAVHIEPLGELGDGAAVLRAVAAAAARSGRPRRLRCSANGSVRGR